LPERHHHRRQSRKKNAATGFAVQRGKEEIVNHIIPTSDPLRRSLWRILDEIHQTNGAHRHRLADRARGTPSSQLAEGQR